MSSPDAHGLGPLLERSLTGDAGARNALFGRLRPYLKALVRSWLGPELARRLDESSIAQESLLRIENGWDGFRGRTVPELLGWSRRIALNLAHDRKRHLAACAAAGGDALHAVPDGGPSPLDALVHDEEALRLAAALERLSEPRRTVLLARLVDGLPCKEVARRMGRKSGALRVLFKRAVAQLRQLLEDEP
jgi:RNA polymerase sigma factor (sigma-70 family)